MSQKTIYFAHPMCDYGTAREAAVMSFLQENDYTVINPADFQEEFQHWLRGVPLMPFNKQTVKLTPYNGDNYIQFWVELSQLCDACAFCAFDDELNADSVPAGLEFIKDKTHPGLEWPVSTNRIGAGVRAEVESFWTNNKPVVMLHVQALIDFDDIELEDPPIHYSIREQKLNQWDNNQILLTVEQTKALLRASGRYDG